MQRELRSRWRAPENLLRFRMDRNRTRVRQQRQRKKSLVYISLFLIVSLSDVEIVLPEGYVFRTDSYIQLSRHLSFYRNTFSITFRPVLPDGLLFFSSQTRSGRGDFIAITLTNGYVSLHFTLGQGRLLLMHDERLTMESVHTVTVR